MGYRDRRRAVKAALLKAAASKTPARGNNASGVHFADDVRVTPESNPGPSSAANRFTPQPLQFLDGQVLKTKPKKPSQKAVEEESSSSDGSSSSSSDGSSSDEEPVVKKSKK